MRADWIRARVGPASSSLIQRIGVVVANGALWVSLSDDNTVDRYEPAA